MAKSTHSQEVLTGTSDSYTEHELTDPNTLLANRPVLGEVDRPSVGMDSSQSSESVQTPKDSATQDLQAPAPTTESHSETPETEDSDALSTDGNIPKTESESAEEEADFDSKTPTKKSTPRKSSRSRTSNAGESDFDF
jgi:hypothetical protein